MSDVPYTSAWLRDLAVESVTDPRSAAARLLAASPGREALKLWLPLVAILNGMYYSQALPVASQGQMGVTIPAFMTNPIALSAVVAVIMVAMSAFFVMSGRLMGGKASLEDVLLVTCWLQSLRLAAQFLITAISTIAAGIGALLALVAGVWGIYVLANFLTTAHRFDTPLKGIATMAVGVLGFAFAMSFLLAILGLAPPEAGL